MKSKNILRKALSVFMTLIMAFSVMAVGVNAEDPVCTCTEYCTSQATNQECPICNADYNDCEYIPTSGNCGAVGNESSVTWNFDTATGTLTISGTGAMADYTYDLNGEDQPWFNYRRDITKIVIGYGVTEIGVLAFYNCENVEEVVFERNENGESSVTSIGNNAVRDCLSLTEIEIPASVETIGDYAFRGCNKLTTVTFEEGSMLDSIGKQCFYGNISLEEYIIPSEVTSIGDNAFRANDDLKHFYYPAGVDFGTDVFYDDSLLEYFGEYTVNENDKTCSIKYIGVKADGRDYTPDENAVITASEIVIPEKIYGYKVTSVEIGETTVSVPESFEAPHTTTKLSDITALEGWEYEAETDEIPAGSSVEITASYNLSETQKLTRKITVSRTACKDEDRDGLCDYGCGKRFSYSSSSSSSSSSSDESPNIEGKNGRKGWSAILDVIEDTKEGEKVVIDMNDATEIPRNILSEIKGKDITIVLNMDNGFIWTINGKDVENPETIDMGVKKGTRIPVKVINEVTGESEYIEITLSHNGDFGFKAVLTVDMGKNNKGNFANLYYYNGKEMDIICSDEIDENGKADLTFTHASEYVIVIDDTDHTDLSAGESIKVEEIVLL